jgi:hypothetical protein
VSNAIQAQKPVRSPEELNGNPEETDFLAFWQMFDVKELA